MSTALLHGATILNGQQGPLKLHLGCGKHRLEGWVNCDLTDDTNVDMAFDVQKRWPFEDNSALIIYASHMLEHLTDPYTFYEEAWRVLVPNGSITLRLPYGFHAGAWWDLTHIRPWVPESFCIFQPGHGQLTGNPQHDWKWPIAVEYVDMRISGAYRDWLKWKFLRKFLLRHGRNFVNFCEEMWVYQTVLKTPEAVADYERRRPNFGTAVYTQWVMYRHQWEGRPQKPGERLELLVLGEDKVRAQWADGPEDKKTR